MGWRRRATEAFVKSSGVKACHIIVTMLCNGPEGDSVNARVGTERSSQKLKSDIDPTLQAPHPPPRVRLNPYLPPPIPRSLCSHPAATRHDVYSDTRKVARDEGVVSVKCISVPENKNNPDGICPENERAGIRTKPSPTFRSPPTSAAPCPCYCYEARNSANCRRSR
ncbi:hypothetical protein K438DRAFT_1006604 [Mycena galopus ATCC 62051]|nr:hypothetical protein K438DRAFT_1006604 [Mycena galopus ATCC 62051]